jgi:hypothetical protein
LIGEGGRDHSLIELGGEQTIGFLESTGADRLTELQAFEIGRLDMDST